MATSTNSLTSHNGESRAQRADKMSAAGIPGSFFRKAKSSEKKFYNRKRRMFLKNENNWEKF